MEEFTESYLKSLEENLPTDSREQPETINSDLGFDDSTSLHLPIKLCTPSSEPHPPRTRATTQEAESTLPDTEQ